MNIFFDIECVKTQNPDHIAAIRADKEAERAEALAAVKAPANYKDAEKIAAFCADAAAKINADHESAVQAAIDATVFDAGYGQIVCIGWAINDAEPQSLHVADLSAGQEAALLRDWFAAIKSANGHSGTRPVLIGHNSNDFDIPYVWRRSVIHSIHPPMWWPKDPKPWSDATQDTMTMWAGAKSRISMDRLCKILGIPGKQGISGADVWPMVQAGKFSELSAYCRDDVSRTRAMWRRMWFA